MDMGAKREAEEDEKGVSKKGRNWWEMDKRSRKKGSGHWR